MSEFLHLKEWLRLPDSTKLNIYTETGRQIPLPAVAVEKDWWVVHTLALIFSMECAPSLIFKGGTSLSKAWNLIDRFSEDIDLVLDREFLGFKGELTSGDIKRLRRASYAYLTTTFTEELKAKFSEAGFSEVEIKYREVVNHDQDPIIIEIYYKKLTETETYLKPGLLVEVGSRSLKEPFTQRTFNTLAGQNYAERPFADKAITIPVVNPERTFLEKIFLLHEEFQRPKEKIRVERLSRHLYDVEKLSKTEFVKTALANADLYTTIVAHRKKFAHISGVDYDKHIPEHINFIPPNDLLPLWEADYKEMQENMIYRESLPFVALIEKLSELQNLINSTKWDSAPSYKQTEVGLIPVDWEVKKIRQVCKLINGRGFKPFEWKREGLPIIRIQNLNGSDDYNYFQGSYDKKLEVEDGQLLFAWSGSRGTSFGPHIWKGSKGLLNYHTWKINVNEGEIVKPFFNHALKRLTKEIEDKAHGASALVHTQKWEMEGYEFAMPPNEIEQTAIATALSDADALINSLEKLIAKKRNIKQGAMQKLLEPKEDWEVKKLGDVVEFLDGKRRPIKDSERAKMQGVYPYYGASGIIDYVNDFLFDDELILLGEDGENIISRNQRLAFKIYGKAWVNNHAHVLKPKIGYDLDFLAEKLESLNYEVYNSGTAQPKLNQKTCSQINIVIPPTKQEQTYIAKILSDMNTEIDALETKLEKYRNVKLGMMQNLLTGKIRLV